MSIFDTVAQDIKTYVEIASRLDNDANWRQTVSRRIRERSHLIWERLDVVNSWASFLKSTYTTFARGTVQVAAATAAAT